MVIRKGVGAAGCLVYLVLIAAALYFGSPLAGAYIDYYRYRDAMRQEARFAVQRSDTEIQSRLRLFADSLGLPRSAGNVRISRGRSRVVILGNYVQTVSIPVIGPKKIRFTPKAEDTF